MMKKNILVLFLLSFIGLSLFGAVNAQTDLGSYSGSVSGNNQYMFRNRLRFQIAVNSTVDLDIDVSDDIGNHEFQFQFNCSEEGEQLRIRVQTEDPALGLEDGKRVQAKNQNQYRYQYQYMMNLSYEGEGEFQAKLQLKTQDGDCTWAYYDEVDEQWETVESEYVDGMITTETDHFSVWTVLSNDKLLIPGYTLLGVIFAIGVVSILLRKRA